MEHNDIKQCEEKACVEKASDLKLLEDEIQNHTEILAEVQRLSERVYFLVRDGNKPCTEEKCKPEEERPAGTNRFDEMSSQIKHTAHDRIAEIRANLNNILNLVA